MTSIQKNHSPSSKTQALFFSIFTNCWLYQGAIVGKITVMTNSVVLCLHRLWAD